jgi:cell division protein FtsQ
MRGRERPAQTAKYPRSRGKAAAPPARFERVRDIAGRLQRRARRWTEPMRSLRVPRGAGLAGAALLVLLAIGYGVVKGEHVPAIVGELKNLRDDAANAAGFRIQSASVTGRKQIPEREVLAIAGVSARSSLLFFDVEAARNKLKGNPWIAEAEVRKLYPGRLHIAIEEREAFALWQKDGKIAVVATDGATLAPFANERRFAALPLVVGPGANAKAKDFLAALARHPAIGQQVRAAILIAERRWNLRLKNGTDVRLPETEVERALDTLARLDAEKQLLSRDVMAIDLRLPDRVSVRLSDAAAQAREEALKKAAKKKKGGDA